MPAPLPKLVWKITAVAVLGSFLCNLDATIINVSLATLATDLHTTLSTIQWVTSGYLLALALVLPLNGWLVDRIGAKRLYVVCFTTFTLSSALCGFAWSAHSLIGFRVLQGVSGGLLAPMAQMMIARAAGREHMARVMGYAALPVLMGPILGPVVAGAIVQHASWRWLFLINLPAGALGVTLALLFLPAEAPEDIRPRPLDLAGLALLSPALVFFLYTTDHLSSHTGALTLTTAVALLAAFYLHARRKGEAALLDLALFRNTVFRAASTTQFLSNGISFAAQMLIPYFLIRACHLSAGRTGLMMAPLGLGMFAIYGQIGNLTKRFGIRRVSVFGSALALTGTFPLLWIARDSGAGHFHPLTLAASLFARGVGLGMVGIPSVTAAYASVPRRELPMATTTLNIVQRLGGPTVTTLIATFLSWRLHLPIANLPLIFLAGFAILGGLHLLQLLSASRLPLTTPTAPSAPSAPSASVDALAD